MHPSGVTPKHDFWESLLLLGAMSAICNVEKKTDVQPYITPICPNLGKEAKMIVPIIATAAKTTVQAPWLLRALSAVATPMILAPDKKLCKIKR